MFPKKLAKYSNKEFADVTSLLMLPPAASFSVPSLADQQGVEGACQWNNLALLLLLCCTAAEMTRF
jgi:hypothetical protein